MTLHCRIGSAGIRIAAVLIFLSSFVVTVPAADIPWKKQFFDLQATNEPLNVFLIRLFTVQGMSAIASPTVATGRVNGRFKGRADVVFDEIADTYGLTYYYDGSVMYVYSLSEVESRLLQVEPMDVPRVERTLKQMRLIDPHFTMRTSVEEGQIFVSGPPRYLDVVADVVARVADNPSHPRQQVEARVFRLKYARAMDTAVSIGGADTMIPGVARLLSETLGGAKSAQSATSRQSSRVMTGLRGKGLAATATASSQSASASSNGSGPLTGTTADSDNTQPLAWEMTTTQRHAASALQDAGPPTRQDASVRADGRLNAVIVRDTVERMPLYAKLIEALDVDTALLEIEASVIDVDETKSEQLGIDWRAHGPHGDLVSSPNGLAGNGSGTSGVSSALDLLAAGNPLSAGTGLVGTVLFGSTRDYFLGRVNALTESGNANLVSKPRILTLDNTEAVVQNTRDFYVRVAGRDSTDLYNVTLGLSLRVTPTVIDDVLGRRVRLQIRIEDGTIDGTGTVDQIPIVSRNAIATQAVVGDSQSLLIGGYVVDERTNNNSGVPGLSGVPILGWLFGQKSNTLHRVERMFMITPRLLGANGLPVTPQASSLAEPAPSSAVPSASLPSTLSVPPATTPTSSRAGASRNLRLSMDVGEEPLH